MSDTLPPPDWQPSEEDRKRMREAPNLDLDAHLGGKAEEESGLRWLEEQEKTLTIQLPNTVAIRSVLVYVSAMLQSELQHHACPFPDVVDAYKTITETLDKYCK